jgi:hypothetical protein
MAVAANPRREFQRARANSMVTVRLSNEELVNESVASAELNRIAEGQDHVASWLVVADQDPDSTERRVVNELA